ncbi:group 1 truncated hemoglobin [Planktothrix sp. FACHB-1355]|uniref:Group 1 truncated hemoglobin n=1 Tax=Aerosakkonema funiforme FACHB-1375 TaxID=2949571 RepID=A0A926VJ93_9CYAN|nr:MULTISPECIES: group 1 truncated hemoglobin [Oscillatoriales]MBD2184915.1 group 1 truncated hemoglobin [Aerosakkonema funiforme FACHB-1375]MBD3561028.1 group 1 truncated hemoglobin [Planktothrix sp. FACHB-1355]
MDTEKSLYEKVGGQAAIEQIVDDFYNHVLADDTVNKFFANTDMKKQRRHQTAFISYALGGPQYTGRSMEKAHAGLNLQPEHFDAIAKHLGEAMTAYGISQDDINTALDRVASLKDAVLYK